MENTETSRALTDLAELKTATETIRNEIGKVITGQQETIELLLAAMLAEGHVLLEGVPGVAKTLMARVLARSVTAGFSRIQFTPDLMPSDILGTTVFHPPTGEFTFRQGPVFSQIVLIDEINRAPAKTQSALFEVMEEGQVTMDGKTYPLPNPFLVLATQNPIEHEGTYRLPEAQLDRFLFKLAVGYPSLPEEVEILRRKHVQADHHPLDLVMPVLDAGTVVRLRSLVKHLHIEPDLLGFIARIIRETRDHPGIYLGASPRAGVGLLSGAKALAALQGRDFVTPEDIVRISFPVLRHRILLTPEKEMEGVNTDQIITQVIHKIEVPR
ncbi:MAG TPA: MoxR family ATPase [Chitinophagaceae bacterium]|nr:MoxR family ATPase [Chitinophagaceae bacterium]